MLAGKILIDLKFAHVPGSPIIGFLKLRILQGKQYFKLKKPMKSLVNLKELNFYGLRILYQRKRVQL